MIRIIYLPLMYWSMSYMNKEKKPILPTIIYVLLTLYPIIQSVVYRYMDLTKLDHKMKFTEFF